MRLFVNEYFRYSQTDAQTFCLQFTQPDLRLSDLSDMWGKLFQTYGCPKTKTLTIKWVCTPNLQHMQQLTEANIHSQEATLGTSCTQ